jgi:hypothetical protein
LKHRFTPYVENMFESGMSCLLTMVQGNVLALTLSHWLIASQTGLVAGAIVGTTVLGAKLRRPWLISLLLGVITIPADALVHPGSFTIGSLPEAAVTGAGAFALSLLAGAAVRAWMRRRLAARATAAPSSPCQLVEVTCRCRTSRRSRRAGRVDVAATRAECAGDLGAEP